MRPRPAPRTLTVILGGKFLRCHACGRGVKDLGKHARCGHLISAATYRRVWALPPDTDLRAPATIRRRTDERLARWDQERRSALREPADAASSVVMEPGTRRITLDEER